MSRKPRRKYKDGKAYKFEFGDVTVEAIFEGLTEEVTERFNRLCAEEMVGRKTEAAGIKEAEAIVA